MSFDKKNNNPHDENNLLKNGKERAKKVNAQVPKSNHISRTKNHDSKKADENNEQINDDLNEYIMSLMKYGTTSETYADTWNKPTYFDTPGDAKVDIDIVKKKILEMRDDSRKFISSISNEVDMTNIINLSKIFGERFVRKHAVRLGFTPFIIISCLKALQEYPIFNAHMINDNILLKSSYDISLLTCGNDCMTIPVIRNADQKNFVELEKKMITLSERALRKSLALEEVSGGTFTIINAGANGSLIGNDFINTPQVASLSFNRVQERPVAINGKVEVRPMAYITLSYNSVVIDNHAAMSFLNSIKEYVENQGWDVLGL